MHTLREILSHPVRRALAFNTGWLLADRVGRMAVGLLVGIWVARYLGPSDYGVLNLTFAFAAFFLPFASLGLEKVVVRELSRTPEARPSIMGSAFALKLAGAFAGVILAALVAYAFQRQIEAPRLLLALVLLANLGAAFDVVDYALQASERFDLAVKARGLAFVVCAAGKLGLIAAGASVVAFGGILLVEAALAAACLAWVLKFAGPAISTWRISGDTARTLLRDGWPVLGSEYAVMLFQRTDLLLLGWLAGEREAGLYAAAQRVAQLAYFIPPVAGKLLFPTLARESDPVRVRQLVQQAMNWLVAAGYLIAGVTLLLHESLIRILFGANYAGAGGMLCWLAGCIVFVAMGSLHSLYLVSLNRQVVTLRLAWLTAIVSVGLNLLLVPRFAGTGAALAAMATYGLTTTFGVALYRDSRPLLRMNLGALIWPVRALAAWLAGRKVAS